ncbi:MAG: DNA alkylation repair protein [Nitrospirae bacterium GWC2_56_14]|nr:MAG: DNA alkylation repair protein [Nitrospirae bacterium GWC2_56_14]
MTVPEIQRKLRRLANKEKAGLLQGFFKTGPGQYGEGDVFLGITVPLLRKLAKECRGTSVADSLTLLRSEIHEQRLLALFLLIHAYARGDEAVKKRIYGEYLKNTRFINNWDLVDLSAPNIVGDFLAGRNRKPLYALARSRDLWKKRIAILATFRFIKENDFVDALAIAGMLVRDEHDLIHKAVGWMLREVGKRDMQAEEGFLQNHYRSMPRTMLRYAIERFPEAKRQRYLKGKV